MRLVLAVGQGFDRLLLREGGLLRDDALLDLFTGDDLRHDVDKLFARLFGYLIERLSSYSTPTGTLLDEGASVWLSDVATGDHSPNNLPYVVAGSAGGFLKTGLYVDAAAGSDDYLPHNRFLNTIGSAVGCKNKSGAPLDDFGDVSLPRGLVDAMLA